MKRISAGLLSVVSLAFVLGACSKSNQVEDKVQELMSSSPFDAKNVKVDCPGDVKAKKGEAFDCTVNGTFTGTDTTSARAHITFSDDNNFVIDELTALNGSAASSSASEVPSTDTSTDNPSIGTSSDTLPGGDEN